MRSIDLMRRSLSVCGIWHLAKSSTATNLYFSTCSKRQSLQKSTTTAQSSDNCLSISQTLCNRYCLNKVPQRTMAGHAHWANVKHTKEAVDAKHMAVVQSFIQRMKASIKESGPNPDTNSKLAKILDKMKAANIPKNDIKRYFENATKKAGTTQTVYFEIRGPIGTIFVMEAETDNLKRCRDQLNTLMKKTVGQIKDVQSFKSFFDMKGMITVPVTKDMQISNMDEYLEIAIETGAEDVILTKDELGEYEYVLKFHCDPVTYKQVASKIEKTYNLECSSSSVELMPHHYVTLESEDTMKECETIANKLQSHSEYVNLFDNISLPTE